MIDNKLPLIEYIKGVQLSDPKSLDKKLLGFLYDKKHDYGALLKYMRMLKAWSR
jgi:hypothetical protein